MPTNPAPPTTTVRKWDYYNDIKRISNGVSDSVFARSIASISMDCIEGTHRKRYVSYVMKTTTSKYRICSTYGRIGTVSGELSKDAAATSSYEFGSKKLALSELARIVRSKIHKSPPYRIVNWSAGRSVDRVLIRERLRDLLTHNPVSPEETPKITKIKRPRKINMHEDLLDRLDDLDI